MEIKNLKPEEREIPKGRKDQRKAERNLKMKEQRRFVISYKNDPQGHSKITQLIEQANQKSYGRVVTFKDLVDYALNKIAEKDLEKVKRQSLGEMDKVEMMLEKYNQKHATNLSLGEFLVKRLRIKGGDIYGK